MALYTGIPPIEAIYYGAIPVISAPTFTGPQYLGDFPDLSYENNIAAQTFDVKPHFSNATGGTYSITIDPPRSDPQNPGIYMSTDGILQSEPDPLPEGSWGVTVTVTMPGGQTASGVINVTVTPEVASGTTAAAPSYDGLAQNLTLTSGQAMSPVDMSQHFSGADLSYSQTGFPSGLSVNSTTGVISGTPTGTGTANVSVIATNGSGTATATFTITR